jgi:2,5-diketo-D-gluconate reductase A
MLEDPIFERIGAKYGKTPGQTVLRWHIQLGLVAIPRTTNTERLKQNIDVFDFALSDEDMAQIATISRGPDAGVDSDVAGH